METGEKSSQENGGEQTGLAANADATNDLGFVANADLAQLDAGVEHSGKLFDELTESRTRSSAVKLKSDLGAVEGVFHIDKLISSPQ